MFNWPVRKFKKVLLYLFGFFVLYILWRYSTHEQNVDKFVHEDLLGTGGATKLPKCESLTAGRLNVVARMEDADRFDDILQPFMQVRVVDTDGNRRVQQHIRSHMIFLGYHIEEDNFDDMTPMGEKNFNNIIATLNPNAPRRLSLVCHFDSKYYPGEDFIGATDSAVPCAMMIDLAYSLNDLFKEDRNEYGQFLSLQLIFLDGEEAFEQWTATDSIYGARHLAEQMANKWTRIGRELELTDLTRMDAFILLDLIGTRTTTFKNWFEPTSHLFERMKKIEASLYSNNLLDHVTRRNTYFTGGLVRSNGIQDDHIPFLQKEVPILHLISYPFPREWHKMSDNAEALDDPTIFNLLRILRVFLVECLNV